MNKIICFLCSLLLCLGSCGSGRIDRRALVHRHIPTSDKMDVLSPFSVGNGEFAFTADITGLQTFNIEYDKGIPLGTHAQWGWHSIPNPNRYQLEDTFEYFEVEGRQVPYAAGQHTEAGQWLRANPHRLHLGRLAFDIRMSEGRAVQPSDLGDIQQTADIWQGIIYSSFTVDGHPVTVQTACHPDLDQIAVCIRSTLLLQGRMAVILDFPCGSLSWGPQSADWNSPDRHASEIVRQDERSVQLRRILDADRYNVLLQWEGDARLEQVETHSFRLSSRETSQLDLTCHFSKQRIDRPLPGARETIQASRSHWEEFWMTGGAVDLSGSPDPRAQELERRVILSRYLTAIQCAGSLPPAETGLTCNSWYGKFHLEMHWWHAIQFALWGNSELLEKSLPWYETILPMARKKAERQGYRGVRWPKMAGPNGRESPSTIGVFLIWQQPHPIYYAELLYSMRKDEETLQAYRCLVFESAEFMASYARWEDQNKRFVLGPPLIPAQEIYEPDESMNPAFELAYWKWGLKTAQAWRERLGLPRDKKWDHVIDRLSPLPESGGLYQNAENALKTFDDPEHRKDHPTLLAAMGFLPGAEADTAVMRATLDRVMETWNWDRTWGWDYPLIAMTAARVGRPDLAVDALLLEVPRNTYLNNGHNYQTESLPIYLPGNGGLLAAVAMMAAGWEGAPDTPAPGFPEKWRVKWEGLSRFP